MKRISFCCDGTWNRLDAPNSTNVVKLVKYILPTAADGTAQVNYYDEGVGARSTSRFPKIDKVLSGMFGWGLMDRLEAAYRFLVFNYDPGDEIFIFGFSRGAYTARSLAGLIRNCGIPRQSNAHRMHEAIARYRSRDPSDHPDSDSICKLRSELSPNLYLNDNELKWRKKNISNFKPDECRQLTIRYVGVWDTVGALGVPRHLVISSLFNKKYQFHDDKLSSTVKSARHAVAIDERRRAFEPALWSNCDVLNHGAAQTAGGEAFQQVWFPGDHSSIGGGGDEAGLANASLVWIIEGAEIAGLKFLPEAVRQFNDGVNHLAPVVSSKPPAWYYKEGPRRGPQRVDELAPITLQRWHDDESYRPETLSQVANYI